MTDDRLTALLERIDRANEADPESELDDGRARPKAWLYGQRMSARLAAFAREAGECLQIAVRAQHIMRWTIPRADYPMDRAGYRKWRTDLAAFHAEKTGELMQEEGYDTQAIERVGSLLRKQRLKVDAEAQTLEDVACLVFLEFYLMGFAATQEESKLIDIVRKSWGKMSQSGRDAAQGLQLSDEAKRLVGLALASGG